MMRSMMNAQRRGAMTGAYTEASGALNVEERTALRRLARHYLQVNRERVVKERAHATRQAAQDEADRLQVCACIRMCTRAHADTHADASPHRTLAFSYSFIGTIHFNAYNTLTSTCSHIHAHTGGCG